MDVLEIIHLKMLQASPPTPCGHVYVPLGIAVESQKKKKNNIFINIYKFIFFLTNKIFISTRSERLYMSENNFS